MNVLLLMTLLSFQENKTVFVDRVAIKVNDKIITERELLSSYKQRREAALTEFRGAELDKKLKEAWADTVKDAEESLLMYEKASELGYAFSKDDVRTELLSMKESRGLTQEEFEAAIIEQTGMTLDELVDLRQRENSAQMVFQSQVLQRIVIEDNEVARYYETHLAEFMNPATYRIAEIVFLKNPEDPTIPLQRSLDCKAALEEGMDFAEAAKKFSESPSRENGGDLGLVKFGDLLSLIEDHVKVMEVGSYSKLLETPGAWFLIKLLERNPEHPKHVDEVREEVVNKLRMPRTETRLLQFIAELRAEFSVKSYVQEIPWYLEY